MENTYMITVDYWRNIPSGESVCDGYNGEKTAPLGGGFYTLYEIADENNTHCGWRWVREDA